MQKVNIFGVEVFNLNFQEAADIVKHFLKSDKLNTIFTPNTEIVMAAKNNFNLKNIINSADLVIADGIGLIYGSKMRKKPLKERVTGYDISMELLKLSNDLGYGIYFLGAKPGVCEMAKQNVKNIFSNANIVGTHHGYFKGSHTGDFNSKEEEDIIDDINKSQAEIVFVGLGFPKQEEWIYHNKSKLVNAKVIIGNGGVIDILSGNVKRAPDIFIKLNLEWFYRLITDPKRIKRQMAIPKFLWAIVRDKNSVK